MLHIIHLSSFYPPKIDVALKITIGSKNSDFKSHINFGVTKGGQMDDM
jgi:hypothetical protein